MRVRACTQEMLPCLSALRHLDVKCMGWDDASTASLAQLLCLEEVKIRM